MDDESTHQHQNNADNDDISMGEAESMEIEEDDAADQNNNNNVSNGKY